VKTTGTPIIDDLKDAIDVMIHPTNYEYKTMSIREGIIKYYKVMLIPMILALIISVVFAGNNIGVLGGAQGKIIAAVAVLIIYIIGIPIELLISAFLVQLISGSILKWSKGGFNATFSAYIYSIFPALLIGWLSLVLILESLLVIILLGSLLVIIIALWSFILLLFALAKLQNISPSDAFLGLFLAGLILGGISEIIAILLSPLATNVLVAHGFNLTSININRTTDCGNFYVSDYNYLDTNYYTCTWSGGNITINLQGGDSGHIGVKITSLTNGTVYYAKNSTVRCLTPMANIYLPPGPYQIYFNTGAGGGSCGPDILEMNAT